MMHAMAHAATTNATAHAKPHRGEFHHGKHRLNLPVQRAFPSRLNPFPDSFPHPGEELDPWAWVVGRDWREVNDLRVVLDQSGG